MSIPKMPDDLMPDLKQFEEMAQAYRDAMPGEWAGAMNLMAHPMAGAAAMSAMGFAMAGHAFGMWAGTMAGVAQASQRMWAGQEWAEPGKPARPSRKGAKLELVSSTPAPDAAEAAMRTVMAEAERTAQDVTEAARKVARGVVDDAVAAVEPARKAAESASKAPVKSKPRTRAKGPSRPKAMEKPGKPDDLKAISGIGPKLEQMLNGYGIWTHAQIADFATSEIAWLDEELGFAGRIKRDDWLGQAARLRDGAGGK